MLANGIKLGYSTEGKASYKDLVGLKEVPEFGLEPEKVENTVLTDKVKKYELGIGDAGELEYTFKYENKSQDSPFRVLRKLQDDKTLVNFQQTYPDGTTVSFAGQVAVKLGGGGVNGVIDFTLKVGLQSDLEFKDPANI